MASLDAVAHNSDAIPWALLRNDPGLLLFLLSRNTPFSAEAGACVSAEDGRALADALADDVTPWLDWRDPRVRPIVRSALAAAHFAEILAEVSETAEPAKAWTAAWLAYAGWLAAGVTNPVAISDCLGAATFGDDPFGTQLRIWGKTRGEIAWRLSASWNMPQWARVILGRIDLPPDQVGTFGGDRRLQAVVQIAIVLAEQVEARLFIADEFDLCAALAELKIRSVDLDQVRERFSASARIASWLERDWTDPRTDCDLIARLSSLDESESNGERDRSLSVDFLAERVQAAKLSAMAEFAAGASHEINNPLAVISGQSQYLLKQETDETRRRALQSIVRQTRRIHSILTELMYFARPSVPQTEWVELGRLIREAAVTVAPLAADRDVDVEVGAGLNPLWIDVDPRQMTTALAAVIRNGVEAAPSGGWVKVSTVHRADRLDIIVDDNGAGLDDRSREHLFDPFFSGRSAGRGRGLGLSAAWRLVREHGGELQHVPNSDGATRFVISLSPAAVITGAARKSA
jgi:signal transduction histidine kinase